jgi:FkbM family methyltransferase
MFQIISHKKNQKLISEITFAKNKIFFLDFNDDLVLKEIIQKGEFEPLSISIWINLILNIRPVQVYDIGSYTGLFGLIASKFIKNVIYVEANPFIFKRLQDNLLLNNINLKQAHWGAIVAENYKKNYISLNIPVHNLLTSASTVLSSKFKSASTAVPAKKISTFLNESLDKNNKSIIFKIDTEGNEKSYIGNILKKSDNFIILLEILDYKDYLQIVDITLENDYAIYSIQEDRKIIVPGFRNSRNSRNYILAKKNFILKNYIF